MNRFIPYAQQWIDNKDIESVVKVLKSDWLTTGPTVKAFENIFAKYVGAKFAVAVSNGTAALHAAAFVANIQNTNDEVIVTPMTFSASSNCVLYNNGKPIFADINKKTYNIDINEIKAKITKKTKAIIPVNYTGQPCDIDLINEIAKKHNLMVIEDASHALGAKYKGKKVGSLCDMSIFSFHPVKHITTGEGGMITTNDKELYEKLIMFRNHGITKNKEKFISPNNEGWFYEQQFLGFNYRLSDINCALGISQLQKINYFINRRKEIVKKYNESFKEINNVTIPYQLENVDSSWHLYVLQINLDKLKVNRTRIFNDLHSKKIGVQVHYIPIYFHPYYQQLGYKKGLCPNAEWLYERILSLPLFPKMKDGDVSYVIDEVKKTIEKYSIGC